MQAEYLKMQDPQYLRWVLWWKSCLRMLQSEPRKENSQKAPVPWFNFVVTPRCDCTALSSNRTSMLSFSCLLQACTESNAIWFVSCPILHWCVGDGSRMSSPIAPPGRRQLLSHSSVWFSRDAGLQTLGFMRWGWHFHSTLWPKGTLMILRAWP